MYTSKGWYWGSLMTGFYMTMRGYQIECEKPLDRGDGSQNRNFFTVTHF